MQVREPLYDTEHFPEFDLVRLPALRTWEEVRNTRMLSSLSLSHNPNLQTQVMHAVGYVHCGSLSTLLDVLYATAVR